MSAAYKCDKCSQFKTGSPHCTITATRLEKPWAPPREVCQECATDMLTSADERAEHERRVAALKVAEESRRSGAK